MIIKTISMKNIWRFLPITLVLFFILNNANSVFAQSSSGVELKPASIEQSANPGETIDTTFKLKNVSVTEQTYFLVVKDINGVRDNGVPLFAEENAEKTGFELSSWVGVSEEAFVLAPNQETVIPVKIQVPADATPGSHFGGIFVTVEAPNLRANGAAVGYEVGAIVSIRIAGDVVETARIREFSTDRLMYSKANVRFKVRVDNPGTVLIRPRGPLEIFNTITGKRLAILTVNDSFGGVFPGTTRDFEVGWESTDLAFGRYQGVVALLYGEKGNQTTVSAVVSFWVLPAHIILPILGIILFIVLAVYFGVRLHIKRTLDTMVVGGARRVPARRRRQERGVTSLVLVAVTILSVSAVFLVGLLVLFS